jgi:coenzyme F420 hydrogenase subunit beta
VTTALVQEVISAGGAAVGAGASAEQPTRTVPVRLTTKEEALAAAGSRYAPVATAGLARGLRNQDAFVGKPCEVAAIRALTSDNQSDESPVLISFFCAGTPSQLATEKLANGDLGINSGDIKSLRYRGRGWPGDFTVESRSGVSSTLSYKESWGRVLGKSLQWRCKICPDGTGQLADIVVGDFWESDEHGYPKFGADSEGRSVVICRTERGHDLLMHAVRAGAVRIQAMKISRLEPIQPLQVDRRVTMAGRLLGATAAGRPTPRFRGFGVVRLGARHPYRNFRAGTGAFLRVLGRRA